ncbi:hypothetical protein R84B8_00413 [Treponema sp. R8-4-B8]
MRLWTIQAQEAYKQLRKNGVLHASEEHVWCEDSLRHAYDWMAAELAKKDVMPEGIRYPIWAWYQWQGKRKKRDLRERGFMKRGNPAVQLEIEIPDNKVLLSDFDVFHCVLNNLYVCSSEEDHERFEKWYESMGIGYGDWKNDASQDEKLQIVQRAIVESWAGVFDLTKEDDNYLYGKNEEKSIQAVFWELREDQVIWAREFIAK